MTMAAITAEELVWFTRNVLVDRETGCHLWRGKKGHYTRLRFRGGTFSAHHLAYASAFGWPDDGLNILHNCDAKGCVNPWHLRPGTLAENRADQYRRWRPFPTGDLGRAIYGLRAHHTIPDLAAITNLSVETLCREFRICPVPPALPWVFDGPVTITHVVDWLQPSLVFDDLAMGETILEAADVGGLPVGAVLALLQGRARVRKPYEVPTPEPLDS